MSKVNQPEVPSFSIFICFYTIVMHEIKRFMRIWTQTLVPSAITMSLYFVIFGQLIGSQLHKIQGFTYMQYIVPGLILMSVMMNAYTNTAGSFFLNKFNRSIEEVLVSPASNLMIILGYMCGGALRGVIVGCIVLVVSLFFTSVPIMHISIILLTGILTASVFALGGFINAIFAKRFDDISYIPTFVLTPLTYLGGVFYSINELPPFWRQISHFNPIVSMVDGFRYGILGIADTELYSGLLFITLCFVVLLTWAFLLLHKGVGVKS